MPKGQHPSARQRNRLTDPSHSAGPALSRPPAADVAKPVNPKRQTQPSTHQHLIAVCVKQHIDGEILTSYTDIDRQSFDSDAPGNSATMAQKRKRSTCNGRIKSGACAGESHSWSQ
jgi:hypothetical protein